MSVNNTNSPNGNDEEMRNDDNDTIMRVERPGTSQPHIELCQRSRRPTEKGKEYEINNALKNYNKCVRLLKRSLKGLDLEASAPNELKSIKNCVRDANAAIDNLEDSLLSLKECLDSDDYNAYAEEFNRLNTSLIQPFKYFFLLFCIRDSRTRFWSSAKKSV